MNAPPTGAASANPPAAGGTVLIDLTESVVRAVHGGAVVEWPTTVGYLDAQSTDPNRIVAGEPIARALGANPLSGVRLLPTLVDASHILLNNRPHAVGDLLTRLLAPALPAKAAADDPEIVVAHPSTWGLPRAEVLRASAARLGVQCSLLPRSLALARALADPSGRAVAVVEAQASSVDISLLASRDGAWSQLESRRLSAHLGISLTEMGSEVARELSDILQEKFGKSDCSKALDGLIIDAPPRLAEAVVTQIQESDPPFDRIIAAPKDGVLRGLAASAIAPARTEPEQKPQLADTAPNPAPLISPSAPVSPSAPIPSGRPQALPAPSSLTPPQPPPPLAPQPPSPPVHAGPPAYQPSSPPPPATGPQYGRPAYTPQQLPVAEQRLPEPVLPLAPPHAQPRPLSSSGRNASLDSAFPEPRRPKPRAVWIGAAAVLAASLLVGGTIWLVGRNDSKAPGQAQGPSSPPLAPSHGETVEAQLVNVPDPDSNGAILFSFQLPATWEQAQLSACSSSQPSSTEERSFRSAPLFFHSPSDPCAEIGIRYEGLDSQATLQSVGENIRQEINESSGRFTSLQFGVPHGQNTFNSYDQPERNASWFLYVAPHKDSKLLVSIGCRNAAQGSVCEKVLQTLKVAP
ncbi:MAG: hypothetical protein ACRC20_04670 [Segniliparus sp.]|uniref:hypothetical protein n=1 Tax=Segniliparus sp. TaxID=2804064 RepID=UPI003F35CFA5